MKRVRLEVIPAAKPIDLRQWVRAMLREILSVNGVAVRDEQPESEPLKRAS